MAGTDKIDIAAAMQAFEDRRKGDTAEQARILNNGTKEQIDKMVLDNPDLASSPAVTEAYKKFNQKVDKNAPVPVTSDSISQTIDDNAKANEVLTRLLENDGKLARSALGANNMVPNYMRNLFPDQQSGISYIGELEGIAFLNGVSKLKGFGSLSDAEGSKITKAASALFSKSGKEGTDYIIGEEEGIRLLKKMKAASDTLSVSLKDDLDKKVSEEGGQTTTDPNAGIVAADAATADVTAATDAATQPPVDAALSPTDVSTPIDATTPPVEDATTPAPSPVPATPAAPIDLSAVTTRAELDAMVAAAPEGSTFIRNGATKTKVNGVLQ